MEKDRWSHPFFCKFDEPQPGQEVSFTRICPKFLRVNTPWTFLDDSCSMCVYKEDRKEDGELIGKDYCCYPQKQTE